MGRSEKFRHGLAKEKRLFNVVAEHGWDTDDVNMAESLLGTFYNSLFSLVSGFRPAAD